MVINEILADQRPAAGNATVLVVDDEVGPRESLRLILTPSYRVVLAKDGEEALERFEADPPDMIISDIRMPRLGGIELLKKVKERSPETPFILLTGYGTLETAQEAVRTGAFDYISKPYNVEDIRKVVAKAFEETRKKQDIEQTLARLQNTNMLLEASLQELDQKAALGDLSAEIIHDLNNPICALQGYVELLECTLAEQHGFHESEEKEVLGIIKQQAERCIQLTRRFLDYAKTSKQRWACGNINELLEDTLFVFRARLRMLNVNVETDLDENVPNCWLQTTQTQQVFYNLIANALQAMAGQDAPKQLRITTQVLRAQSVEPDCSYVRVVIKDSGPGIPEAIRDQIFERFFTTKGDKGTGLGLAICQRIIQEHHGRIELTSEPGQGTQFMLTFPIRTQPPKEDAPVATI